MNNENLNIGDGIYTMPDISKILGIPNYKVNRWIKRFWEEEFSNQLSYNYSWIIDNTKAVNFHTTIELYVFYQISKSGVKSRKIVEAHKLLSEKFNTQYPFANNQIIKDIKSDGRKIYFSDEDGVYYSLDAKKQFNLDFIEMFFKKIDFDSNNLALRFWPIGKKNSVVCDPTVKFGLPTIENSNIYPETLYDMFKAGDNIKFLAEIYGLTQKQVKDAIKYCKEALKIYIDENLAPQFAHAFDVIQEHLNLKEKKKIKVLSIKDEFYQGVKDEEWIPLVGKEKGVVITNDRRIQQNKHQRELYKKHGVGIIFLHNPKKGCSFWDTFKHLVKWWDDIKKITRKNKTPLHIDSQGRINHL